jgi:hypothetical protein
MDQNYKQVERNGRGCVQSPEPSCPLAFAQKPPHMLQGTLQLLPEPSASSPLPTACIRSAHQSCWGKEALSE